MKSSTFVTKIDTALSEKIMQDLKSKGFIFSKPPYTLFLAKGKDVSVTLYASGKLMVQGKAMAELMEYYIEPEILKSFDFSYQELQIDYSARIGIDEAGKGDFFGPLCVAGVYCSEDSIKKLAGLGVKDSKKMNDLVIGKLAQKIKGEVPHEIIRMSPLKYNQLYEKFGNLNHLLAWGHATCIEQLVKKTGCKKVLIDQFAAQSVVQGALRKKGLAELDLTQRHRGEEDLVVAAASILARDAFVQGIYKLGQEVGMVLPKGASSLVIAAGRKYVEKYGKQGLTTVAKLHFKTTSQVLSS